MHTVTSELLTTSFPACSPPRTTVCRHGIKPGFEAAMSQTVPLFTQLKSTFFSCLLCYLACEIGPFSIECICKQNSKITICTWLIFANFKEIEYLPIVFLISWILNHSFVNHTYKSHLWLAPFLDTLACKEKWCVLFINISNACILAADCNSLLCNWFQHGYIMQKKSNAATNGIGSCFVATI